MQHQKMIKAVMYICPTCKFEMWESVENLKKEEGFDGKNLKKLSPAMCHCCHRTMVKPTEIRDIPEDWMIPI